MGDGGAVALNVNATSFSATGISGTNAGIGFTPGPWSTLSTGDNTFGDMNLYIKDFDGYTRAADYITFTLNNLSGTWANASAILTPTTSPANKKGYEVEAHTFVAALSPVDGKAHASSDALATGYVSVPEPGILILLGIAMGAIGVASWKIPKL